MTLFRPLTPALLILLSTKNLTIRTFALSMTTPPLTIDSHLHVWANPTESSQYPFAAGQDPPSSLRTAGCTSNLLKEMKNAGVNGALIVQPINHKFDHSYVSSAIAAHPSKFKGVMLHDPSLGPKEAVDRLDELALKGFVGVRFNPYLWKEGSMMSSKDDDGGGAGLAVYERCGELNLPVGVMCFKGLDLHYDDVVSLVESCPETTLILDHFGFAGFDERGETNFESLLSLSRYPSVVVKISALFRIAGQNDVFPYEKVRTKRFVPLLERFGAERLLFGTDFPFVLEQEGGYKGTVDVVRSWTDNDDDFASLMGGTAQRLFGFWGTVDK